MGECDQISTESMLDFFYEQVSQFGADLIRKEKR